MARSAAGPARCGSTPFSQRFEPSVRRRSRSEVRKMPYGSKFAASSRTRVVPSPISVSSPPMIPASAVARSASAISRSSGVELAVDAVEGAQPLARPRAADDDPAAAERVEVERVQRVAEREHHVVRHVDDVRDRPHPRRVQPRPQPQRRRRDRDVLEQPADVARAAGEVLDLDRHRLVRDRSGACPRTCPGGAGRRALRPRARCRRSDCRSGRLPVDSTSSTASASGSTSASGVPGSAVGEQHDPGVVGAEPDLVLGEDHPVGDLAAHLAPLELEAVRQHRAGQRDRDGRAGAEVPRAADDRARLALADVDLRQLESVGVRVLHGLEHAPDAEAPEVPALVGDAAAARSPRPPRS